MKTVIALKAFSNGVISMFKGEIRDLEEIVAQHYIDEGYVAEYSESGGGSSALEVNFTLDQSTYLMTCDKTYEEIQFAVHAKIPIHASLYLSAAKVTLQSSAVYMGYKFYFFGAIDNEDLTSITVYIVRYSKGTWSAVAKNLNYVS